jgi:hypothetical protein
MTRDSYKQAFSDLKTDISKLLNEREKAEATIRRIDSKLRQLTETVRSIGPLSGADPEEIDAWTHSGSTPQVGFTEAVRTGLFLLRDVDPATAVQIRDVIEKNGLLDLNRYENALASIYTVLGRMVESKEVEQFSRGDNKRAFKLSAEAINRRSRRESFSQGR